MDGSKLQLSGLITTAGLLMMMNISDLWAQTAVPPTHSNNEDLIRQFVEDWPEDTQGYLPGELSIDGEFFPVYDIGTGFWEPSEPGEVLKQTPFWLTIISHDELPVAAIEISTPKIRAHRTFKAHEATRMLAFETGDRFVTWPPTSHYFLLRSDSLLPISITAVNEFPQGTTVSEYAAYIRNYIEAAVPATIPPNALNDARQVSQRNASADNTQRTVSLVVLMAIIVFAAAMAVRHRPT